MLSQCRQNMCRHLFAHSQNFSKICWRVKRWHVVLRPRRKPHWVSPAIFFKALSLQISMEAKKRGTLVVGTLLPDPVLLCGDNHPNLPILRCPSRTPGNLTHESAKEVLICSRLSTFSRRLRTFAPHRTASADMAWLYFDARPAMVLSLFEYHISPTVFNTWLLFCHHSPQQLVSVHIPEQQMKL